MSETCSAAAIHAVLGSTKAFCKFLSANDTGATGGHQAGILVSKSAVEILFPKNEIDGNGITKRLAKICWQDDFSTESTFTYYASKNELRITRFGRGFPFLKPEQTGALFVFAQQDIDDYQGYFLETDDEMEEFLNAFAISPAETNRLIDVEKITPAVQEKLVIEGFVGNLAGEFPLSADMAAAARIIEEKAYDHAEYICTNPDKKIISWLNVEYSLFRAVEQVNYGDFLKKGFSSVDEFVKIANIVLNRRKSRAGKSLEHHLSAIFDGNALSYSAQATTEGGKKPDFLFPSQAAYLDKNFPAERLLSLAAKTTCKDRWRQILNEANRLKDRPKYLFTLQQGISEKQMQEMEDEKVVLVVPQPYIAAYPPICRERIWTLAKFIKYAKYLAE